MQKIEVPAGHPVKVVRSRDVEDLVLGGWRVVYAFTQADEVVARKRRTMSEADVAAYKARNYNRDPDWSEKNTEYDDREIHPVMMFVMVHEPADELGRLTADLAAALNLGRDLERAAADAGKERDAAAKKARDLEGKVAQADRDYDAQRAVVRRLEESVRSYERDMGALRAAIGEIEFKRIVGTSEFKRGREG